jgi:hypothetical protein
MVGILTVRHALLRVGFCPLVAFFISKRNRDRAFALSLKSPLKGKMYFSDTSF